MSLKLKAKSSKPNQSGFHHVMLVLVIVVIGAVGFVGWRVMSKDNIGGKEGATNLTNQSSGNGSQESSKVVFSENIFDPSKIKFIGPLGELNGGYIEATAIAGLTINIKPEALSGSKELEIKAPADMTLNMYSHYIDPMDGSPGWSLYFRFSGDVVMRIDHITRASDKVIAATTSTPKNDSRTDSPKNKASFKAGEVFAYSTGTAQAHNWNIYLYDKTHKNNFVNQARYEKGESGQRLINAACAFDYYSDETKKAAFLALMGQRKAGETNSCGEVSRDKKGTLAGMWHFSDDNGTGVQEAKEGKFESPFSIYKNSAGVISINQIDGKRIDVEPGAITHKDPAEVTSEHCYAGKDPSLSPAGYVFLKLVNENQMQMAYSSSGSCPASFPASGAKTYYR